MAAPYRKVHCRIWSDDKFPDLSDDAQLVWFHAYTCEYSTGLGIFKASVEALAADKGWPVERYREGFREVMKAGLIRYDQRRHVIAFPRFFRWNPPENPNVLSGLLKGFDLIPDCDVKYWYAKDLIDSATAWGDKYQEVAANACGTFAERSPNQEQEQEQEQEEDGSLRSPSAPSAETPLDTGDDATGRSTAIVASRATAPEPIVENIPLNDGSEYAVTEAQADEWARLFPAVDVPQALRAMRAWSVGNKPRRKTRRGIERFITNWLSKDQDKGGNAPRGGPHGGNSAGRGGSGAQSSAAGFWEHFGSEAVGHG